MDKPEKRIDLNSELGMSRRDLIRRGAIVGGTLLWVAPAIQSMAPKAFAATGEGSVLCVACQTNFVDNDGTGGNPGHFEHTNFDPTTTCCDCLNTPGETLRSCDRANKCVPISGEENLPDRCPSEVP